MSENTKIEWCDHTFNPWEGCQAVSPGCDHCYAEARNKRFGGGTAVNFGPGAPRRRTSDANWNLPEKWNNQADAFMAKHGRRQRVFCASLADVFDNAVDAQWRADLFELIESTPNLDWLLLTKRIGNVQSMIPEATDLIDYGEGFQSMWGQGVWPANVWLGATITSREEMLRDAPKLAAIPARVRFWSVEPILGDLGEISRELIPDWVICGGESGPNARPMHPDWARSLRDQCAAAGVPFLFKQWGEWRSICQGEGDWSRYLYKSRRKAGPDEDQKVFDDIWGCKCTVAQLCLSNDGRHKGITEVGAWRQGTAPVQAFLTGKKAAGRLLDGIEHNGFPE